MTVYMYGKRAECQCGERFRAASEVAALWWASGHMANAHKRDI